MNVCLTGFNKKVNLTKLKDEIVFYDYSIILYLTTDSVIFRNLCKLADHSALAK